MFAVGTLFSCKICHWINMDLVAVTIFYWLTLLYRWSGVQAKKTKAGQSMVIFSLQILVDPQYILYLTCWGCYNGSGSTRCCVNSLFANLGWLIIRMSCCWVLRMFIRRCMEFQFWLLSHMTVFRGGVGKGDESLGLLRWGLEYSVTMYFDKFYLLWHTMNISYAICVFQNGDDYEADSDRPVSVLKEHTIFTDTHL